MPIDDKPLPAIQVQNADKSQTWLQSSDNMISQIREATYSPSPLIRILHDPSILPHGSPEYAQTRRARSKNRPSRSPRRHERRTEVVAALAIAEEEKQSRQLKSLLRGSGERLEYEIRRADTATLRAEIAERQEKINLARLQDVEGERDEIQRVSNDLERDLRNYQTQLEATQRELMCLQADLEHKQREMEELRNGEGQAQTAARKYQLGLRDLEMQMVRHSLEVQNAINEWYNSGKDEGYEEGYDAGRKAGFKQGVKKGRKEGLEEGIAKGKHEERKNAMDAIERFLANENGDDSKNERTRRWAQSIYNPNTDSETLYPVDSGSVILKMS